MGLRNNSMQLLELDLLKADLNDFLQIDKIRQAYFGPFLSWTSAELKSEVEKKSVWILKEKKALRPKVLAYLCDRQIDQDIEILSLATDPDFLGRGCMTLMLKRLYLDSDAAPRNRRIFLEVHKRNQQAISFYSKLGFKEIGIRQNYYMDGGEALVLEWIPDSQTKVSS